ncbi:MAG TPA: hypothetical protein VJC20_00025 [Candidatus Paceibacterota bacterium]
MKESAPSSKNEYFLDLDMQVSTKEVTILDGTTILTIYGTHGEKTAEITHAPNGNPTKVVLFSRDSRDRIFTDPKILAEVDQQVRGLLGEVVTEERGEKPTGAVQEGSRVYSAEELKEKMLNQELQTRQFLESLKNPRENPKGH